MYSYRDPFHDSVSVAIYLIVLTLKISLTI